MAITNYTNLQEAIKNWLNRDDLTDQIPDFIGLVETDLNRQVRHWRMEQRSTAVFDTRYTLLPTTFLEAVRLHLDTDERPIELLTALALQTRRMQNQDTKGKPQYYAIIDGQIEVWPTPDADYTGELFYYTKVPELSSSNTTNWVLDHFHDVYLYGALMHASPYIVDDQRAQTWSALYQRGIDGINSNNNKAKFGGSGLRLQINTY